MDTIEVTLNESDMSDFLSEGLTPEQTRLAISQYCQAYRALIEGAYRGVEVTVEAGPTPMGTVIRVDGMTHDYGEVGETIEVVTNLADRLVNDWSWLNV